MDASSLSLEAFEAAVLDRWRMDRGGYLREGSGKAIGLAVYLGSKPVEGRGASE
jgi:hypothetical protein